LWVSALDLLIWKGMLWWMKLVLWYLILAINFAVFSHWNVSLGGSDGKNLMLTQQVLFPAEFEMLYVDLLIVGHCCCSHMVSLPQLGSKCKNYCWSWTVTWDAGMLCGKNVKTLVCSMHYQSDLTWSFPHCHGLLLFHKCIHILYSLACPHCSPVWFFFSLIVRSKIATDECAFFARYL
jgi:hypothetical protein